jgi:hypothetical protein
VTPKLCWDRYACMERCGHEPRNQSILPHSGQGRAHVTGYVCVHLARNRPAGAPRAHRIRSTSKRKMRGKYQNCTSWLAVGGRRLQASDSAEKRRTSLDRNVAGKRGRRAGNAAVMSCGRVGLSRVRRACVDVGGVSACMHGTGRRLCPSDRSP